jgi:hypothetical protein
MRTSRLYAALLAAVMTVSLGACSKDKEKPKKDPKAVASATADESVDPANVSPPGLPTVPKVRRERGAIQDLSLGECATKAGKQTVTGEITSSAKRPVDYLVTVSWTTGSADVKGRGFAVLQDVAPGATESFEITAKVADGATQCVQGASYGQIG